MTAARPGPAHGPAGQLPVARPPGAAAPAPAAELLIELDRAAREPLRRQLETWLRAAIADGSLPDGTRLPSSRSLAQQLAVSRGVVVDAYEQLIAQGLLVSRPRQLLVVRAVAARTAAPPRLPARYRYPLTTRAALPSLLRARGSIINISSNAARMPHAGPVPYTTSKAALTALGKALAEEFGPQGVRVNTISPGPVRTAMWEAADGYGAALASASGVAREQLVAGLPATMGLTTGRLIEPAEIASLAAYLASPHAASFSGADLVIDAGAIKAL